MKRYAAMLIIILILAAAVTVYARPVKATYTGADCAGQVCTIEATSKPGFTTCRYFAPGEFNLYEVYLGRYDAPVTATALQTFCETNFENRVID